MTYVRVADRFSDGTLHEKGARVACAVLEGFEILLDEVFEGIDVVP
jgi:hypothetical protein